MAETDLTLDTTPAGPRVRGRALVKGVTVSDGTRRLAAADQLELTGLDAQWPRTKVERVRLSRPRARIGRDRDGRLTISELVESIKKPAGESAAAAPVDKPTPLPPDFAIEVGEVSVEDGRLRLDDATGGAGRGLPPRPDPLHRPLADVAESRPGHAPAERGDARGRHDRDPGHRGARSGALRSAHPAGQHRGRALSGLRAARREGGGARGGRRHRQGHGGRRQDRAVREGLARPGRPGLHRRGPADPHRGPSRDGRARLHVPCHRHHRPGTHAQVVGPARAPARRLDADHRHPHPAAPRTAGWRAGARARRPRRRPRRRHPPISR